MRVILSWHRVVRVPSRFRMARFRMARFRIGQVAPDLTSARVEASPGWSIGRRSGRPRWVPRCGLSPLPPHQATSRLPQTRGTQELSMFFLSEIAGFVLDYLFFQAAWPSTDCRRGRVRSAFPDPVFVISRTVGRWTPPVLTISTADCRLADAGSARHSKCVEKCRVRGRRSRLGRPEQGGSKVGVPAASRGGGDGLARDESLKEILRNGSECVENG